jgi:hypothetical protein
VFVLISLFSILLLSISQNSKPRAKKELELYQLPVPVTNKEATNTSKEAVQENYNMKSKKKLEISLIENPKLFKIRQIGKELPSIEVPLQC